MPDTIRSAQVCLPSTDLSADLAFFTETLGFRLDTIYPADDPAVATVSGHGLTVRLERGSAVPPGVLRLLCDDPDGVAGGRRNLTAPNGVRIRLVEANPPLEIPPTVHAFLVRRLKDNTPWIIGRAGMQYRDLIPGRLGGSIIASHIRIPDAGPVPDMVHFHTVGFQLIFCVSGWVRLVYEDQGPPFDLCAGDAVIQPPQIRHRVLESSPGLEVIEIGCPAEHMTCVDHVLPRLRRPVDRLKSRVEVEQERALLEQQFDVKRRIAVATIDQTGMQERPHAGSQFKLRRTPASGACRLVRVL